MNRMAASAPGKLVLLGEYAVLYGHPAVVAAVNRRARVTLEPAPHDRWTVVAPGYEDTAAELAIETDGVVRWCDADRTVARRLELPRQVIAGLIAAGAVAPAALASAACTLDSREFFSPGATGPAKLGLGSSAALTVALGGAIQSWASDGRDGSPPELASLLELHRSFQGGRGSGIDLAASRYGGVLEYRLDDGGRTPVARPLELPRELHMVAVWTGRSASTGDFLARLDERLRTERGTVEAALDQLGEVAAAGVASLDAGDVAGLLDAVDAYAGAMDRLGRGAGIPILSPQHEELRRLASAAGVRSKPSGAGGGDIGLGFTDDPCAAEAFASAARDRGFVPLDLSIDPNGLVVDHTSA